MIWLVLVSVVFVGGGAYLIARHWLTRGIVFFAGLVFTAALYLRHATDALPLSF